MVVDCISCIEKSELYIVKEKTAVNGNYCRKQFYWFTIIAFLTAKCFTFLVIQYLCRMDPGHTANNRSRKERKTLTLYGRIAWKHIRFQRSLWAELHKSVFRHKRSHSRNGLIRKSKKLGIKS